MRPPVSPQVARERLVRFAHRKGWRVWGGLRLYGGSRYQAFRKGNQYCWIGLRFIEKTGRGIAIDFVLDMPDAKKMLEGT